VLICFVELIFIFVIYILVLKKSGRVVFLECSAPSCDSVRVGFIRAKFHYTDPTGPARTQRSFAAKKSVRVRAGPVGSGRVRVGSV